MKVGTVKEIKKHEYLVGLTPNAAEAYVKAGHSVLVEKDAGKGSGYADDRYIAAGAKIASTAWDVWAQAEMIVKVKNLSPQNMALFGKTRFCTATYTLPRIGPRPKLCWRQSA